MTSGKVSDAEVVFTCPPFKVLKRHVVFPNLSECEYFSVFKGKTNQYVVIIGIGDDDTMVLINQWRPTTKEWNLSLPMGAVDANETPLIAAKREFLEETGYSAGLFKQLGMYYESPGHSAQKGFVFLATKLKAPDKPCSAARDETEVTRLKLVKIKSLIKLISTGKFKDGSSLNALAVFIAQKLNKLS